VIVFEQQGNTQIDLPTNAHVRIGAIASFDCSSQLGCVVTATGTATGSNIGQLCFKLDGPPPAAIPSSCWDNAEHRSVFTVPYGSHKIWLSATGVRNHNRYVSEWEADYSIYNVTSAN
jgi:hypothetical protein